MAYTQTVYANDNPPAINASNLNKMEQGIYDAHQNNADLKSAIEAVSTGLEPYTFSTTIVGNWYDFNYPFIEGMQYGITSTSVFSFRTRKQGSSENIDYANSLPANTEYIFTASGNAQVLKISTTSQATITVVQKTAVISEIDTMQREIGTAQNEINTASTILNAVTENYIAYTQNLYNSETAIEGYRLNSSGEAIAVTGSTPNCYVSDYIPIENNTTYSRNYYGGDNPAYHRMSFYNSNKVHQYTTENGSYTNSSNYAYMRICGFANEKTEEKIYGSSQEKTAIDYIARSSSGDAGNTVDLIVFAGQSNMAGRGITSETWPETAPSILPGAGFEFKAYSDPTRLYPMAEPFGYAEDNPNGINDDGKKTGSMVVSFTNAYYTHNGKIPVVGVSASQGDTYATEWIIDPEGASLLTDLITRFNTAVTWLTTNGYTIRHKYCLWCQGEADGGGGTTTHNEYKGRTITIFNTLLSAGFEKVFVVRIGHMNAEGYEHKFDTVIIDQTDIAREMSNVVMASTDFASMRDRGLMKDRFHYYQAGYNEIGEYAGVNVALYATTGKEPTMYDPFYDNLYYSTKN